MLFGDMAVILEPFVLDAITWLMLIARMYLSLLIAIVPLSPVNKWNWNIKLLNSNTRINQKTRLYQEVYMQLLESREIVHIANSVGFSSVQKGRAELFRPGHAD